MRAGRPILASAGEHGRLGMADFVFSFPSWRGVGPAHVREETFYLAGFERLRR